ncbi:helix-turn-helix domain-containing protein [uncultured Chryseobacterium sp.]|uniref:helix-turn-helix domain-containing protein n=1 Tax=uncultured Chryseobacterium sp. TaxID=259322 RepID=UPI0025CFFD32|nr:helix-turn-helix domain-containing protein [uncultured Chryseobacterium sp.]
MKKLKKLTTYAVKGIVFLSFLIFYNIKGQTKIYFEDEYNRLKQCVQSDIPSALKQIDRLILDARNSGEKKFIVKGLYLKSFAYLLKGEPDSCFENAQQSLDLAEEIHYKEGQALAYRMLGTQYAKMETFDLAMQNFDRGLNILDKMNSQESYEVKGLILNSKLIALGDDKEVNVMKEKLNVSLQVIQAFRHIKNPELRDNQMVSAYTNVGYNYADLGNTDSANLYFKRALSLVKPDNYYLQAAVNHDIGYLHLKNRNYPEAIAYLKKALNILPDHEGFVNKKIEVLKNLSQAYSESGDQSDFIIYSGELKKLTDISNKKNLHSMEKFLQDKNLTIQHQNAEVSVYSGILIFLLLVMILLIVFYLYKSKQNKRRYEELRSRINTVIESEDRPENVPMPVIQETTVKDPGKEQSGESSKNIVSVSEKTTELLRAGLDNFENGTAFLEKNFTSTKLASLLGVSPRTLSDFIKTEKNMNFNWYINDLRIRHFIQKLDTESGFRKFKLTYIADYLGYSSLGAFSNSFKQITGIGPSYYMKNRNKELEF